MKNTRGILWRVRHPFKLTPPVHIKGHYVDATPRYLRRDERENNAAAKVAWNDEVRAKREARKLPPRPDSA